MQVIPRDFSATERLLKHGQGWANEGSFIKSTAAHTVVPVMTVATAALDAVAHALGLLIKTVVFLPRVVVLGVTYPFVKDAKTQERGVDFAPGASLPVIIEHTYRAVGNVAMIIAMPLASFFSCSSALTVLKNLKLATVVEKAKGFMAGLKDQPTLLGKAKYLVKEPAINAWNQAKSISSYVLGEVVNHKRAAYVLGGIAIAGVAEYAIGHYYRTEAYSHVGTLAHHAWEMVPNPLNWIGFGTTTTTTTTG